ncbi:MAG: 4-hydroxythreonine-4-phosphate dehydrogenase PdxA [Deltaproteobacteria bacterium]|nr:4-hydroxythreonine-4-phosphate dehydrogenase PdxA [Deltaproteobacteria bacterium]
MTYKPVIGITMGDPVGIGPEVICRALARDDLFSEVRPVIIGDPGIMAKALESTGVCLNLSVVANPGNCLFQPGCIEVMDISSLEPITVQWAEPDVNTAKAMLDYITTAVDLAIGRDIDAMVTAPINKVALKMAECPHPGHTELIATRTGCRRYAMMLAGKRLRVVLVTIHTALSNVPGELSIEKIVEIAELTHESLTQRFGIDSPKIAVAGLNPHAGEEGMFGDEEIKIIRPAIERLWQKGIKVAGPFPPDTIFYHAAGGMYDAVVCMYHDQGLIPFKLIHFYDGVNTTLGLPIIRTSVDHGTAYDIAGKGIADPGSLVAAIDMAALQSRCAKKSL